MTLRRDFLAFTAGAVVARTVLPAVSRAAPIPAYAAFWEAHAMLVRWNADDVSLSDEQGSALNEIWHNALEEISERRAESLAEIRDKASVVVAAFDFNVRQAAADTVEDKAQPHEWAAWLLLHDRLEATA